jgi:hypothetical protein
MATVLQFPPLTLAYSAPPTDDRELLHMVKEAARLLANVSELLPESDVLKQPMAVLAECLERRTSTLGRRVERQRLTAERKAEALDEARSRVAEQLAESRAAERVWREIPRERREALLFQVLGDERLTIPELADRMNSEIGHEPTRVVYEGHARKLVSRLLKEGQLKREAETFNKSHTRYRYFPVAEAGA